MIVYLVIPVIFFFINEFSNNKLYIALTKFYKCCKLIIAVVPILAIIFNPELRSKIMQNFTKMENNNSNNIIKLKKINKRNVSESKKKYVAAAQQWKCKKCGITLDATYEIDHILPLYKGGSNDVNNLEALCRNCHGNKTLLDRING